MDTIKRAISNVNKAMEGKAKWKGVGKGRREEESNSVNYFFHNALVKPRSLFKNSNKRIIRLSFLVMVEL